MADNAQKTPIASSAQKVALHKALDQIHNLGKELPASVVSIDPTNAIMTVKFETDGTYTLPEVTIPLDGPEYTRYPIQKGDKGVVRAGAVNISNMSGLGSSTAPSSYTWPGNLAALIFHPIGNKNWVPTDDPNAHMRYGPNGTISRDTDKKSKQVVSPSAGVVSSTGAQGATGPTSNPTYNMTHTLHPQNGWLAQILDSTNGTHFASLVPQGGAGALGWLASVFGGAHTHTINGSGHSLKSSSQVKLDAPNASATGNFSVSMLLSAASAQFGSIAGTGGGGLSLPAGSSASGNFGVGGLNSTGPVIGPLLQTTPGFTVAALNSAYPASSWEGARAYVTDATSTTFYSVLAGGGTNIVPAFSNGTNWVCA